MGHELGAGYDALASDTAWRDAKWKHYTDLYARSTERIELLNKLAGNFFWGVIQRTAWTGVLLNLARLAQFAPHRWARTP